MCGIAGVALRDATADAALIDRFTEALSHRGPDDVGGYRHAGIALAHTRLAIIDLNTGHQPLESADGQLVLVANGEIYNHVELRQQLQRAGHRFHTHSDSECILHAYREFGLDMLDVLHGMFAFALFDKANARLLLARDRLGIKPLFLTQRGDGVYFASEPKALLALSPREPELDVHVLAEILQRNFASGRASVFNGIERIAPGEALIVANGQLKRRWQYWSPGPHQQLVHDEVQATEALAELMRDVTHDHLRADVPIGLFLSGGADSGSLLALMHEHGYGPVHTYSVGFDARGVADELGTAAGVARRFDANHQSLRLTRAQVLGRLPLAMWAADELMLDYASLPTLVLAEHASKALKVVFTGEGGDEVFAGYGRYRMPGVSRLMAHLGGRPLQGFRARGSFDTQLSRGALGKRLLDVPWREPLVNAFHALPRNTTRLTRLQQVDITTWLVDDLLVKADRMLMAFGLEGRVPYLDHRIVEFGLSLSDGLKVRGRTGKWILKQWMTKLLPRELLFAPKSGFTVPLASWIDDAMLKQLEQLLPRQTAIQRYFHPPSVVELLRRQRARADVTRAVWAMLAFAVWHRVVIVDGLRRPEPLLDPIALLAD